MTVGLLLCRTGDDAGLAHLLAEREECVIGRGHDCDFVLDAEALSRHHARLTKVAGGWAVADLGSSHGTRVNGEPVGDEPLTVHHCDEIGFGSDLSFVYLDLERVPATEVVAAALLGPERERVPLRLGVNTIGSDHDCDLIVDDPRVSPRHGRLVLESSGVRVERASDAEVRVNGEPAERALVHDGDVVWFADTAEFEIEVILGAAAAEPTAEVLRGSTEGPGTAAATVSPAAAASEPSAGAEAEDADAGETTSTLPREQIAESLRRARERHAQERRRAAESAREQHVQTTGGGAGTGSMSTTSRTLRRKWAQMEAEKPRVQASRREAAARIHVEIPEPADGGAATRTILLREGKHRVGRAQDCRVWLPHLSVSRHHAEVRVSPEGVHVRDLGSGNGTWRGDGRVEEVRPAAGERLRFGSVVVWFEEI